MSTVIDLIAVFSAPVFGLAGVWLGWKIQADREEKRWEQERQQRERDAERALEAQREQWEREEQRRLFGERKDAYRLALDTSRSIQEHLDIAMMNRRYGEKYDVASVNVLIGKWAEVRPRIDLLAGQRVHAASELFEHAMEKVEVGLLEEDFDFDKTEELVEELRGRQFGIWLAMRKELNID